MTKSHAKRFVQSAWTLLTFQFVASVGAVGVTGFAALHVQQLAARLEATDAPAQAVEEAATETGPRAEAVTEPERALDPEIPADAAASAPAASPVATPSIGSCAVQQVIRVQANVEWCDTGLRVQRGDRLVFAVRGRWGHGGEPVLDPGGGDVSERRAVNPRAPQGALIGRAGDRMFLIGAGGEIEMPADGPLQLSINDIPGQFGDNSGSVDVFLQRAGERAAP